MEKNQELQLVCVTTNHYENATMIARNIISEKLAACCSIVPNVTSLYYWEEKLTESNEYLMIIKTTTDKINELENRIQQLHEYEVPEIIAISASSVSQNYIQWVEKLLNVNNNII